MKFKLFEDYDYALDDLRSLVQEYIYDAIDDLGNASLHKYITWYIEEFRGYDIDIDLLEKVVTDKYIEAIDTGKIKADKTKLTSELKQYIESNKHLINDVDELIKQCPDHLQHELKLVIDAANLNESMNEGLLTEKTTTHYELGKHLMADIVNTDKDLRGLRTTIVNRYRYDLFDLCRKLTKSIVDAQALFNDIAEGDWQTHHINGIHNNNSTSDVENLALVRGYIHENLTNENYNFIGEYCSNFMPTMHHEEADKLLLRLIVIAKQNNLNCSSIFRFSTRGFDEFLTKRIPQMLTDNFYKKYPYSTTDVILLRDVIHK